MPDATTQLEEIKARIDALIRQAAEGELFLPEAGRVKIMGLMLDGVLTDTRKRDRRAGAVPTGGLDNSVPAGDRA